ncbi:MAG: AarF/UbiB family protein [Ilumatobacteraceae bacterium]
MTETSMNPRMRAALLLGGTAALVTTAVAMLGRRTGPSAAGGVHLRSRGRRNAELARLGASVGTTYASTAARKVFASAERRIELDRERELKTADAVTERLGHMKGALMKLGQMASYLDDGLAQPLRMALGQLQSSAPPMSSELAAGVIEAELGARPEDLFVEWDPTPIAAASIGQVHRAIAKDPDSGIERGRGEGQYPGVDPGDRSRPLHRRSARNPAAARLRRPRGPRRWSTRSSRGSSRNSITAERPRTSRRSRTTTAGIPSCTCPT